ASWRRFISYLEYKAKLYGRKLIKVNPFHPSSKLCSVCGYKNENLKLSDRKWKCPNCGTQHDRDYNASLNLLKEGLKHIKGSLTKEAVGLERPERAPVESAALLVEAGNSSFQ
ncbi:zinc ribbon domain-containing protein, partial [Thermovibrio sp.]